MTIYTLISLVCAVILFLLANFIYYLDRKKPLNLIVAAMFSIEVCIEFSEFMARQVPDPAAALFWFKISTPLVLFLSPLSILFVLILIGKANGFRWLLITVFCFLPAVLFGYVGVTTDLYMTQPVHEYWGYVQKYSSTKISMLISIWFVVIDIIAITLCFGYAAKVENRHERSKGFYIGSSLLFPLITIIVSDVILPSRGILLPSFAGVTFVIVGIISSYAIWKFRLLTLDPAMAADNILTAMSDAVFLTMPDYSIVHTNKAAIRLSGYLMKDLLKKKLSDLLEFPETSGGALPEIASIKEIRDCDCVLHTVEQGAIPVSVSLTVLTDRRLGTATGTACIVHDISLRKARELELKRSNTELEQFAYIASHDLQEPLRMVSSYLQLLEKRNKGKLDSDSREFIGFAVDGAKRMKRLIEDLLTYSRVSTKGKPFMPVECEKAFESAVKNLEITIQEKNAKIIHDPLPDVMADEGQLVQVFQNLLGNAMKFCKDKKPEIHVSAKKVANNQQEWLFSVQDNGIGIAPEYFKKIFQIFQRLHTREEYEGTGIGLAVCQKTIERHGGRIWVESEIEKGTTFLFTIPEKCGS